MNRRQLPLKIQELEDDWSRFIQIHLSVEAVARAREIARQRALRGADAVHLASALILRSRFVEAADQLVFVVSDHQLKSAAQSAGLRVVDPEEEDSEVNPQPEKR